MTHRTLLGAAASVIQFSMANAGIPCVLPANYGFGRMVWFGYAAGSGFPGANDGSAASFTLFNFNAQKNEYEPVNAVPAVSPSGQSYAPGLGGMALVDATTLEIMVPSATAGACDRALISIAAAPGYAMTFAGYTAAAYTEPGTTNDTNVRSLPVGFNGSMLYGLYVGPVADVYPATNGYVQKVPQASAALRNATALRSSLPTSNTQGSFVKSLALLGGAAPNGYTVAGVSDNVASSGVGTARFRLVNCNATPVAVGTELTYAGEVSYGAIEQMVPISATQVVAFDRNFNATLGPRASLLNTNSATAPTTLTKGTELIMPAPVGYSAAMYFYAGIVPEKNAKNNFFVAGKTVVWVRWYLLSGAVISRPMVLTSTGTANLTASQLTVDLRGKDIGAVAGDITAGPIVSAPGGKVVVFAQRNRDNQFEQFTYQL